jgi:hypothetical protein
MPDSTLTIRGRKYTSADLAQAFRERNNAGEGFADEGLRSSDVPMWQSGNDSEPSVIQRGADVLLIDSKGWAVKL